MHSASGTLAAVPPFDFAKTLRFPNDFTLAAGEQTVTDRARIKALSVNGRAIAFEVAAAGRVYGDGKPLTSQQLQPLLDRYGPYQGYWTYYLRNARLG